MRRERWRDEERKMMRNERWRDEERDRQTDRQGEAGRDMLTALKCERLYF